MKVTRKETIKVFEDMKKGIYPYDPSVYLDIAINSLEIDERYELEYEQIEPCEDAISRQAVLNYIYNDLGLGDEENGKDLERQMELESSYKYIKSLPPVNPQETVTEFADRCRECGKMKKGHWINIDATHSQCDRCGAVFEIVSANGEANYCPNCRAKMQEE